MPRSRTKRIRPRTGYVQVELTPDERAALVAVRDRLAAQAGGMAPDRLGLAGAFRWLLNQERLRTER